MKKKIKVDTTVEINKKLFKSLDNYRKIVNYMAADVPVATLCLPPRYEKALLDGGFQRVYDLFNMDLTKIKGIGKVGLGYLTASLNQFFPVG
jgi:hypothetical protein